MQAYHQQRSCVVAKKPRPGIDVQDDLCAGSLLGSDAFIERMKPLLLDALPDPNILRRERDAARPNLAEMFSDVPDKETRDERIHAAIHCYHYKLQEVGDHPRSSLLNDQRDRESTG